MSMNKMQQEVDKWTSQFKPQYWPRYEILARLVEEMGELSREVNHIYGMKKKKSDEDLSDLEMEVGDILFTLCCFANSHNINLDEAFRRTMNKYTTRDQNRFEKK